MPARDVLHLLITVVMVAGGLSLAAGFSLALGDATIAGPVPRSVFTRHVAVLAVGAALLMVALVGAFLAHL